MKMIKIYPQTQKEMWKVEKPISGLADRNVKA